MLIPCYLGLYTYLKSKTWSYDYYVIIWNFKTSLFSLCIVLNRSWISIYNEWLIVFDNNFRVHFNLDAGSTKREWITLFVVRRTSWTWTLSLTQVWYYLVRNLNYYLWLTIYNSLIACLLDLLSHPSYLSCFKSFLRCACAPCYFCSCTI